MLKKIPLIFKLIIVLLIVLLLLFVYKTNSTFSAQLIRKNIKVNEQIINDPNNTTILVSPNNNNMLNLSKDGSLYILNNNGTPLWTSNIIANFLFNPNLILNNNGTISVCINKQLIYTLGNPQKLRGDYNLIVTNAGSLDLVDNKNYRLWSTANNNVKIVLGKSLPLTNIIS